MQIRSKWTSIFLIVIILLMSGFMSASANRLETIKEKRKTAEKLIQQKRDAGISLSAELRSEIEKARNARAENDFEALNDSLDRIIEFCTSQNQQLENKNNAILSDSAFRNDIGVLAEADERIEKYRQAKFTLNFVDNTGKPVPHLSVKIEQIEHAFLFGANHSIQIWYSIFKQEFGQEIFDRHIIQKSKRFDVSHNNIQLCLDLFYKFANFTSIPVAWPIYEPTKAQINYALYDEVLKRMHNEGIACLAHNLVWNYNTPKWVPDNCSSTLNVIDKRISDFCSYYKNRFDYYLVVNEPARPFRGQLAKDKLAQCYINPGQVPFVAGALHQCRAAYAESKLMINEVAVLEQQGFASLLKKLTNAAGEPLYDVIGIQSHMHEKIWPLTSVWELCNLYGKFNVPIHFTEVTVCSGTPISGRELGRKSTPEGEHLQAEYVINLYKILFSHPSVEAITWWNFSDLWAIKNSPGGLLREDMTPKPAYTALMDLIHNQWHTKISQQTSAAGLCQGKGYFGKYRVTAYKTDGSKTTFEFELLKEKKSEFTFVIASKQLHE